MLYLVLESALGIFKRLINALAARIVFPAVIGAANTAVFDKAVVERYAAMRTMLGDEP
jgi:hypothetical protein